MYFCYQKRREISVYNICHVIGIFISISSKLHKQIYVHCKIKNSELFRKVDHMVNSTSKRDKGSKIRKIIAALLSRVRSGLLPREISIIRSMYILIPRTYRLVC